MNEIQVGWVILGVLVTGNLWILIGLQMNLLKKLDKCEDKLMAMSTAYPHAALIEMQREAAQTQREAASPPLEVAPDWQQVQAS